MPELRLRKTESNENKPENDDDNKKDDKDKESKSSALSPRVLVRIVVITSLFIIIFVISINKEKPVITFARQTDKLAGKGKVVECSPSFLAEVNKYRGCFPKDCGRYVTDHIVSQIEAENLLNIATRAFKIGLSSGGASILDLHSGAISSGEHFINIYKNKEAKGLFTTEDFNLYRTVKEKVKYAIANHFNLDPTKIYLTHPTFFSRLTSQEPITVHDEYWHPHVDKNTYESFYYTSLLYLNDYNVDFEGGKFVFIDGNVNSTIEPRKGRLSMFTSGAENEHFVEKVTKGTRYAITISFTCDKAASINDPNIENLGL